MFKSAVYHKNFAFLQKKNISDSEGEMINRVSESVQIS